MGARLAKLHHPVTITLDGEPIEAEEGEPLAASLLAASKISFARSPKFHRPRGPACMRAACDGCLARVDDVPNVMTCLHPAREGTRVQVQNTLGSREVDLLRVTDWFFPEGIDHHHLFAGVPGVQSVMQAFARRVAGLGQLPGAIAPARVARRREVDVVVVGGGPAGSAVATRLVNAGRSVELLDDAIVPGGGLRALGPDDVGAWRGITEAFAACAGARPHRLVVRPTTVAGGLYGDDLLVVGPEGAEVLAPRALVLATGAHDGVLAFEGNDLPGILSARAAGVLAQLGVVPGERVVIVVSAGGGPFGEALARTLGHHEGRCEVAVVHGQPVRATGSSRVRSVTVLQDGRETTLRADALVVDAPRSPSYELAEQAGATLVHEPRGFVARAPGGKIRGGAGSLGALGVWVVGEAAGEAFAPDPIGRAAADVAAQVLAATSAPPP
jgi:sarcosine oxidase subunit alpha